MTHQEQSTDFDRFMRTPEVTHVTGLSKSTIYYSVENGTFPVPVRLTTRAIAWRASEIKKWMDEREKEVV